TGAAVTGKRGRNKRKRLDPVGRADAVRLLGQTVTKFRTAQVSSSSSSSPSSFEGGASSGPRPKEDEREQEKDAGTSAAEEFAELAARCLGSALPEIALEAHSLYVRAAATGLERGSALLPAHLLTITTATST
ncbi:unnamed protein product, partial [Laminaria digitata]